MPVTAVRKLVFAGGVRPSGLMVSVRSACRCAFLERGVDSGWPVLFTCRWYPTGRVAMTSRGNAPLISFCLWPRGLGDEVVEAHLEGSGIGGDDGQAYGASSQRVVVRCCSEQLRFVSSKLPEL